MCSGENLSAEQKEFTYDSTANKTHQRLPVYEYTLQIELPSNSVAAFAEAEHRARDMTNAEGSETASEVLQLRSADTLVGQEILDSWPGAERADLAPFRPQGIPRLYVTSVYADLGSQAAAKLQRPLELMELGTRIGRAAADEAKSLPFPDSAVLPETTSEGGAPAEIGEALGGIRPTDRRKIRAGHRALPVLGQYDVVVVGGGTSAHPPESLPPRAAHGRWLSSTCTNWAAWAPSA